MSRLFRKYHCRCDRLHHCRYFDCHDWYVFSRSISSALAGFLIHLHTLETFGLESFFPIINGIGLLGCSLLAFT